jgi:hypothetical protein
LKSEWSGTLVGAMLVCALAACAQKQAVAPPPPPYNLALPIAELMGHVVDPAAWAIWRASGTVETLHGTESLLPKDDDGWEAVESGSAAIIEAGNDLMPPGRARDDGDWMRFAQQLSAAGAASKAAAEAKDGNKMYVTGAQLYQVCTDCHAKYLLPFVPKDASWPEHPKLPDIPLNPFHPKAKTGK